MKIVWSPRAAHRLEEIADYIAQDNETAAARFIASLIHALKKIVFSHMLAAAFRNTFMSTRQ